MKKVVSPFRKISQQVRTCEKSNLPLIFETNFGADLHKGRLYCGGDYTRNPSVLIISSVSTNSFSLETIELKSHEVC